MPKRDDISTILLLGSGPIVIGQACEFDYSGTQACKALREEGYRVVLVNSNPATIMTDPALADRTYIEPITPGGGRSVIEREAERHADRRDPPDPRRADRPQLRLRAVRSGHSPGARRRDDRRRPRGHPRGRGSRGVQEGRRLRRPAGPESRTVPDVEDALEILDEIGLPAIIRPAFTLGGTGGGIAYNREEFEEIVRSGIRPR